MSGVVLHAYIKTHHDKEIMFLMFSPIDRQIFLKYSAEYVNR